ncbi:MAG: glycosyltransferase family 4 protein, partial [Desulfobacula sp.]|nr:glycosyltransferase family 4 protein [Desulfobacula sp.]
MLTESVPKFAKKSLETFCKRYEINHVEVSPKPKNLTTYAYWKTEISFVANQIRPDVITNIFAPATLGAAMGLAGRETGARIILRVAGDQIESRIPMGRYDKDLENLDVDMANQTLGIQMADTVIVMSPLEKERICKDLAKSQWKKVLICIRGVDVSRFPKIEENIYQSTPVNRFLFVGRKSLEKGYDILEDAADITFHLNKRIQFAFAGSFEMLKIKNREYIGWIDNNNLQKTFFESDAFIMTSRTEGFPQVAAEAMATGLPCILPKHLFENILEDGKHALLTSLDSREI